VIFDVPFAISILPLMGMAAIVTLKATALGYVIGFLGGLALAVGRLQGGPWLARTLAFMLEFIRSTPLLVQAFFLYFVMPKFGVRLPAFETGVLAIGIHYSAYLAEVFRAGIEGVPKGQWEASTALGLNAVRKYQLVVLPQAIPPMIPALGNYLILMFKDTPLLSAISVMEMMQTAKLIGSETFRYLEPLTIVGAFFLVMSLSGASMVTWAEHRFQRWAR
jgi:polar amino acid transport system permease protein